MADKGRTRSPRRKAPKRTIDDTNFSLAPEAGPNLIIKATRKPVFARQDSVIPALPEAAYRRISLGSQAEIGAGALVGKRDARYPSSK
jgi:hypothetical protein